MFFEDVDDVDHDDNYSDDDCDDDYIFRAGRAGRVREGHCWKLYSEAFYRGELDVFYFFIIPSNEWINMF